MQQFYTIDFDSIYPTPTPQRIAMAFYNRLWRKLHEENFSLLITFYGRHRVGKSLAAVDFAYILDPTFEPNLEKRVVYNGRDLITAFTEIREQNIHGGAVIVDEAGSGELSSQRWYEEAAKIISAELQAVGYLNPFIGFVTQSFSFINTTARRLSQGVFEVDRTHNEFSTIKPFWVENNPWITSTYRKYPIFCEKRGNIVSNVFKIKQIKIGLTPQLLKTRYDLHSQAYKDKLLDESKEELQGIDMRKDQKRAYVTGIDAISREVYENINDYMTYNKKGTKQDINELLIRHRHGIKIGDARLVKELVRQQLRPKPNRHQRKQASAKKTDDDPILV
jgi:hypothetical protein